MKKLIILFVMLFATAAFSADVPMKWNVTPDATGYKIYMSTSITMVDGKLVVVWDAGKDVGNVTSYLYKDVPEDKMILFKGSAYNANGEEIKHWAGVWYDHTKKPPEPMTGLGIQ